MADEKTYNVVYTTQRTHSTQVKAASPEQARAAVYKREGRDCKTWRATEVTTPTKKP